ncbi:hypothetical protein HAX54_013066, partial [Datura stramonium]|nr:hypothetical protein [Datura stramonium]
WRRWRVLVVFGGCFGFPVGGDGVRRIVKRKGREKGKFWAAAVARGGCRSGDGERGEEVRAEGFAGNYGGLCGGFWPAMVSEGREGGAANERKIGGCRRRGERKRE